MEIILTTTNIEYVLECVKNLKIGSKMVIMINNPFKISGRKGYIEIYKSKSKYRGDNKLLVKIYAIHPLKLKTKTTFSYNEGNFNLWFNHVSSKFFNCNLNVRIFEHNIFF